MYHALRGDPDTALDWARRAGQIDPLAASDGVRRAVHALHRRRYDEAVECAERVLSLNPAYAEGYRCLGSCLLALGRNGPRIDALRQAVKLGGPRTRGRSRTLAAALAYLGDMEEAERLLAELEQRSEDQWVSPMTHRGRLQRARPHRRCARGDRAVVRGAGLLGRRLGVEPAWTLLRGKPRFEALVAKVGISKAWRFRHQRVSQPGALYRRGKTAERLSARSGHCRTATDKT